MEEILEGCLRVGARVQTESQVVGFAGFWPGTPGGGPGSPGPPGKPGNVALCLFLLSTLRRFYTRAPGTKLRGWPLQAPPPPPPRATRVRVESQVAGLAGFGPGRCQADKAPRDGTESRAETLRCVFSSVTYSARRLFSTLNQGRARTQSPTTRNYAVEIPTFGEFARVSKARSAMAEPRRG